MATSINEPKNVYICGPLFDQSSEERREEFLHHPYGNLMATLWKPNDFSNLIQ